jgi:hypothetical protein
MSVMEQFWRIAEMETFAVHIPDLCYMSLREVKRSLVNLHQRGKSSISAVTLALLRVV